jgi:hypothetical protein
MLKILVDTCVWLDLAKDSKQGGNLRILEELVRTSPVEPHRPASGPRRVRAQQVAGVAAESPESGRFFVGR